MSDNPILESLGFKTQQDSRPTEIPELQAIDERLALDRARDNGKGLIGRAVDSVLKLAWNADQKTEQNLVDLRTKVQDADQHKDVQAIKKLAPQVTTAVEADRNAYQSESLREGASNFVAGVITTAPLFMRGRRAQSLAIGINALNDIHTTDGALGMTGDAILGGAKGYVLSKTYEKLGQTKMSASAKGLTLGLASRFEEGLLTSQNYRNDQGQFNLGTGLERTAGSVFNPVAAVADVATFGVSAGFTRTLDISLAGALTKNPVAANLIVGSTAGILSGANAEIQNESQTGKYSATDIVEKALLGGASNAVSASLGGRFERTTLFNPSIEANSTGRLPGSIMLPNSDVKTPNGPQTEVKTTSSDLQQPQAHPTKPPSNYADILPDWKRGPDTVDFVHTLSKSVPTERNENALSLLEAASRPNYEEDLVAARQRLTKTYGAEIDLLEWLQNRHSINDEARMAELIGDHPETKKAYEDYSRIAKPRQDFLREVEPVRKQLEDGINQINAENGLPPVQLEVSFALDGKTTGEYRSGKIQLPARDFTGAISSEHVLDVLRHEEEHHVHECLLVAGIIEQIAGNEPLDQHLNQIETALRSLPMASDEDFIRTVDNQRSGFGPKGTRLPLSVKERQRFEALRLSFGEQGVQRNTQLDLHCANVMLEQIEKGNLIEAIDELAMMRSPKAGPEDSGAPSHEIPQVPAIFSELMDEESLKDWPEHQKDFELPTDPIQLTRLAEELKAIATSEKARLEQQLGSEQEQHNAYRRWTHEREAWDVGNEVTSAAHFLKLLQENPFEPSDEPFIATPDFILEAARFNLQDGEEILAVRDFADYVAKGFYPEHSPPQAIRDLVGDEALEHWPSLPSRLVLSPDADTLAAHVKAFEDFLADEAKRAGQNHAG